MKATLIAGCAVLAGVVILLADYVVATRRAPGDDQLIRSLQQQVRADASLAPKLASEKNRITAARCARKSRDNAVAWGLIAAAALFLICAKRVVPASRPVRRQEAKRRVLSRPLRPALPADRRRALIRYKVTENCIGCTLCAQVCPVDAIGWRPYEKHEVDEKICTLCDLCRRVCQDDAIEVV